jgi:hypothetical protein
MPCEHVALHNSFAILGPSFAGTGELQHRVPHGSGTRTCQRTDWRTEAA